MSACRARAGAAGPPRRCRRGRARWSTGSPSRRAARAVRHQPRAQRRVRAVGRDDEIERTVALRPFVLDEVRLVDVVDFRAGDQLAGDFRGRPMQQVEQDGALDAEPVRRGDAGRNSAGRARAATVGRASSPTTARRPRSRRRRGRAPAARQGPVGCSNKPRAERPRLGETLEDRDAVARTRRAASPRPGPRRRSRRCAISRGRANMLTAYYNRSYRTNARGT